MQNRQKAMESIFDALVEQAEQDFLNSEEGKLLQERREKIDQQCKDMLNAEQWEFVQETYCDLLNTEMRKREFTYRQGLRDCVSFLKLVGAL